jgi:hypothetical protein
MNQTKRFRRRTCLFGVTRTINFVREFIPHFKSQNFPLVWLGVEKRVNVFGHKLTKNQTSNMSDIKYVSNYGPATGNNAINEKFGNNCIEWFRSSKKLPSGESQPNEPIPSLGKELTHKHLEKRKLCYSATAIGVSIKFNC